MKLILVGINHTNLTLDQRQSFYFRESDKLAFSTQLSILSIDQVLILSTCNRSEVYMIVKDDFDPNQAKKLFVDYFHHDSDSIIVAQKKEALTHLLQVACGLQSMVVGEDQILHQIKDALSWTMEQGFTGKELNYIFQNVIGFSKRMRHTYALSSQALSVSYIGYLYLLDTLKSTDTIMILGSGEMSKLMLKYLVNHKIYLVNRTYEKVKDYLNDKVRYIPFDQRYNYLDQVNVVVSATSSPHLVIEKQKAKLTHSITFLDLAMPRDIDLKLKDDPLVTLIDMDNLEEISKKHLEKRKEIAITIQEECEKETDRINHEMELMKHDEVISKMQQNYLDLSKSTYDLLIHKLDLNNREKYILKKVLDTQFLRLMKEPIYLMRNSEEDKQKSYNDLMQDILNLKEEDE